MYSDAQTPVGRSLPGTCAVFVRTINTRLGSGSAFSGGEDYCLRSLRPKYTRSAAAIKLKAPIDPAGIQSQLCQNVLPK